MRIPVEHRKCQLSAIITYRMMYLYIPPDKFKYPRDLVYPGILYIEMCGGCGFIAVANCEHYLDTDAATEVSACFWNEDGTKLTCAICGVDAT